MSSVNVTHGVDAVIRRDALTTLIEALQGDGYQVIGPRVVDGAIVYEPLECLDDLPAGWIDEQEGGHYRLRPDPEARALFGYNLGPESWKRYLFPPLQKLWAAQRTAHDYGIEVAADQTPMYAFLGVRACEVHAVSMQDRVFRHDRFVDPGYDARRAQAVIVAVNCRRASNVCFCASMGTGPRATGGFDLCLTELLNGQHHEFLVEVGSTRGAELMERLPKRSTTAEDTAEATRIEGRVRAQMGREMIADVEQVLKANLEHPHWSEVAARCLSCGNCTMVCPTCFCTTVEDTTSLDGTKAERLRKWDSCFNVEFSYLHGGSIRRECRSRYRQWITHKLAHWHDQFGTSGCVGCGRCITWCPVGIDITAEARAIRASDRSA